MADLEVSNIESPAIPERKNVVARFVQKYGWSYAFVLPSVIVFSVFTLAPVVWAFLISFQDFRPRGGGGWVGFQNYQDAFTTQNGVFVEAMRGTRGNRDDAHALLQPAGGLRRRTGRPASLPRAWEAGKSA